jgi:2-succinyl-5-enolpyruvyl-6-hydroxy-3-cyclohexene-1-carboxylate synthase
MVLTRAAHEESELLGEWARLLFGTLQAAGVSDLFISPGSRSTAFTWQALQTRGLSCHAVVDERCASFAALGYARATGRPAALLCTSGSAPANYFPAIIEASLAFLPLLVITADRPFEAQHAGAAQSIDQLKLYGDHVRRYFELGLPDRTQAALVGLRRAVTQATALARGPLPGPVHLNARARKPLEPLAPGTEPSALGARVNALLATPLSRYICAPALPSPQALQEMAVALMAAAAGAIVLGPLPAERRSLIEPLTLLATALGFPILAEASSQMRFAMSAHPLACPQFGWLLGAEAFRRRHAPDLLLYIGATPTCPELERWALESAAARYVLCEYESPDPMGNARLIAAGNVSIAIERLARHVSMGAHRPGSGQHAFAQALLSGGSVCRVLLEEELAREPPVAEGAAVAALAEALPEGAQWVIGNSLPIRDADAYVSRTADLAVLSQRGANGIDGLVSGAVGSALGTQRPTLLLLGDVSLLHDLGGLALARLLRTPLVIAVLDNDGGRIFDQLPVRALYREEARFAHYWQTPTGCDFAHAAQLFGLAYAAPATVAEISSAVGLALRSNSATLLHLRVGSDSARCVRERVLARLAASLAGALA